MAAHKDKAAAALALLVVPLAGFREVQSVLAPQGAEAERIAVLTWVLLVGGVIIFVGVFILAAIAIFGSPRWKSYLSAERAIIAGGIMFPTITLTALLIYGLNVTRAGANLADAPNPLQVKIIGEQWWWRVIYTDDNGERFESANELRIPTGRPVRLVLSTADVIHSFWVPKLAGKLDMIPGRETTLHLMASKPGLSRGQCAEFCGGAHALMSFNVVAMPPSAFAEWMQRTRGPAQPISEQPIEPGRELFLNSGCAGCHTVRGTPAKGRIGPDLTHVASRQSLAAATLPNNQTSIARWIRNNQHIKPENLMPPYRNFTDTQLEALSAYIASLK